MPVNPYPHPSTSRRTFSIPFCPSLHGICVPGQEGKAAKAVLRLGGQPARPQDKPDFEI